MRCVECNTYLPNEESKLEHMEEYHEGFVNIECTSCLKSGFKNNRKLNRHTQNRVKFKPNPTEYRSQSASNDVQKIIPQMKKLTL